MTQAFPEYITIDFNNDFLKLDWSIFENKKLLITGGTGFIASYFIEILLFANQCFNLNIHITCACRDKKKFNKRFKRYSKFDSLELEVIDFNNFFELNLEYDFVVHGASIATPKLYDSDPVGTILPNAYGTINLIKNLNLKKLQCFLFFSSGEIYGNSNFAPLSEGSYGTFDPQDNRYCYGISKFFAESLLNSYYSQLNFPVKIARIFHTYGPGMNLKDGRVFNDFVLDILNNNNISIKSDGSAVRSFCYISDTVLGLLKIITQGKFNSPYNVGNSSQSLSIKDLAVTLVGLYPKKNLKVEFTKRFTNDLYIPSKQASVIPNLDKLQKLNWLPNVDVNDGFKRTIESFLVDKI